MGRTFAFTCSFWASCPNCLKGFGVSGLGFELGFSGQGLGVTAAMPQTWPGWCIRGCCSGKPGPEPGEITKSKLFECQRDTELKAVTVPPGLSWSWSALHQISPVTRCHAGLEFGVWGFLFKGGLFPFLFFPVPCIPAVQATEMQQQPTSANCLAEAITLSPATLSGTPCLTESCQAAQLKE